MHGFCSNTGSFYLFALCLDILRVPYDKKMNSTHFACLIDEFNESLMMLLAVRTTINATHPFSLPTSTYSPRAYTCQAFPWHGGIPRPFLSLCLQNELLPPSLRVSLTALSGVRSQAFSLPFAPLWSVVVGEWDREEEGAREVRKVERVVVHERFKDYKHDIGELGI